MFTMMTWQEICAHPGFEDLPYKVETDARGVVTMSPHRKKHSGAQAELAHLFRLKLPDGMPHVETAIMTSDGMKTADVTWASRAVLDRDKLNDYFQTAPEICVEVVSPTNTTAELDRKRNLYFAAGAHEVWIVLENGQILFYSPERLLDHSALCPDFPAKIEIPGY